MSDDTRERARQVAHELVNADGAVSSQRELERRIAKALVDAARNERIRIADRAEEMAKQLRCSSAASFLTVAGARALEALAAELRAEGGVG